MILNRKSRFLVVNLGAFFVAVAFSGSVHAAECPQLPEVAWWEKVTHASMIDYVKRNHAGDWSPYIIMWENQVEKLEEIRCLSKL